MNTQNHLKNTRKNRTVTEADSKHSIAQRDEEDTYFWLLVYNELKFQFYFGKYFLVSHVTETIFHAHPTV